MKIKDKKILIVRLNKIEGHIKSIKKMIENDKQCKDVLTQLLAVKNAIVSASKLIIITSLETFMDTNKLGNSYIEIKEFIKRYLN